MRSEEMVMSGYNVIEWLDERLKWDIEEYPGIKQINVQPDLVWRPGVVFYNTRDGEFRPKFPTKVMTPFLEGSKLRYKIRPLE